MVVVQELFAEYHWKVEDKQGRVHGPIEMAPLLSVTCACQLRSNKWNQILQAMLVMLLPIQ